MTKKVWFITGASKGLGLTLVKRLLAEGYQVAATSRDVKQLQNAVGKNTSNFLPLRVNIVDNSNPTIVRPRWFNCLITTATISY